MQHRDTITAYASSPSSTDSSWLISTDGPASIQCRVQIVQALADHWFVYGSSGKAPSISRLLQRMLHSPSPPKSHPALLWLHG